mmetsp:Transcript_2419/g.7196  ORF Transcript_2419/g.7196 Transcript_2419/m.7196 type:complete len:287 (+) Transcript_2419:780-1640(+)
MRVVCVDEATEIHERRHVLVLGQLLGQGDLLAPLGAAVGQRPLRAAHPDGLAGHLHQPVRVGLALLEVGPDIRPPLRLHLLEDQLPRLLVLNPLGDHADGVAVSLQHLRHEDLLQLLHGLLVQRAFEGVVVRVHLAARVPVRRPTGRGLQLRAVRLAVVEPVQGLHPGRVHKGLLGLPVFLILVELIQALHGVRVGAHSRTVELPPSVGAGVRGRVPLVDVLHLVERLILHHVAGLRSPPQATGVGHDRLIAEGHVAPLVPVLAVVLHVLHLRGEPLQRLAERGRA